MKNIIWLGPTGFNPELGFVENNQEKEIPDHLYEKYLELNLIKNVSEKKLKRNKNKED